MPEHIRALIVILFVSMIGFVIAKKVLQNVIVEQDFKIWRNTWFVITLAAFLTGNFWIFISISAAYLIFISKKLNNIMALYFILLFTIPPIGQQIPGFGLVNYLINLSYPRFIALIILLPVAFKISQKNNFSFLKTSTDKFILLYILVLISLELRDTTFTDTLRACFYAYIDIFLPYYVASRSIKNIEQMRTVAIALVTTCLVVALIATFESFKGWLLYRALYSALATPLTDQVLMRAGSIRVSANLGFPIILGYLMAIALGFYFFISQSMLKKSTRLIGFLILLLGLYMPVSRGPWVGATGMLIVILAMGPAAFKKLAILGLTVIILLPTLAIIPGGDKILNLIPFVGETDASTVEFRQGLFKNSMIVIGRYPLLGSTNYLLEPEMQALKVNGIIDIVNSYVRIALEAGYIGLSLFLGAFVTALLAMYKQIKRIKNKQDAHHVLLRAMIGILLGTMVIIATVSSIGIVPIVYWSLIGLSIASCQIAKNHLSNQADLLPTCATNLN